MSGGAAGPGEAPVGPPGYVVVVAESDPVAVRVAARWGVPPATGVRVDGSPLRRLSARALLLRRPGPHVADDRLDERFPSALRATGPTLLFPSVHRSEREVACLTVHPLGNPGPTAGIGGAPRSFTPADARLMAAALRRLEEGRDRTGVPATYEATHHGPLLGVPAAFVEIGYASAPEPPGEAVRLLAEVLPELDPAPDDRVALAVGGGHYAPHFTELALRRRWAFGHLLSRHALDGLSAETARDAYRATGGADGVVFARAQDVDHPAFAGWALRRRDGEAPRRGGAAPIPAASGT